MVRTVEQVIPSRAELTVNDLLLASFPIDCLKRCAACYISASFERVGYFVICMRACMGIRTYVHCNASIAQAPPPSPLRKREREK